MSRRPATRTDKSLIASMRTIEQLGWPSLTGSYFRALHAMPIERIERQHVGKSTLFRAIAGELASETGSVVTPARASIGTLPQEAPNGPEPLIDLVLGADRERSALLAEAETATALTASPNCMRA